MKVVTRVDEWGGLQLALTGESSHEDAILVLVSRREMVECSMFTGETALGSTKNVYLMFREFQKAANTAGDTEGK